MTRYFGEKVAPQAGGMILQKKSMQVLSLIFLFDTTYGVGCPTAIWLRSITRHIHDTYVKGPNVDRQGGCFFLKPRPRNKQQLCVFVSNIPFAFLDDLSSLCVHIISLIFGGCQDTKKKSIMMLYRLGLVVNKKKIWWIYIYFCDKIRKQVVLFKWLRT